MAFKFLHTADIHLDSPLRSLALRDPGLADLVGGASRIVLTRIVDLCLNEAVDALIIAGDLYDGAQTSMKTARFLALEMQRLSEAGIPAYLIRGNHDAQSRITAELVLPDSVTVFPARARTIETTWNGHAIALHGVSFRLPHAPDSLLDRFAAPTQGAFNIGLLHTSLGGAPGHDPYAPCSLGELQASGYDYWALGHIHQRSAHPGPTTVVMPGIPQGRDIGEAGEKTVTMVSVDDAGTMTLTPHALAVARFDRVDLPCDGLDDWGDLVAALRGALAEARRADDAEQLILRPVLSGTTPLAWRIRRDTDLLRAEAQAAAENIGSLWIDKLEIAISGDDNTAPAGAVGELAALIDADPDQPLQAAARDELAALMKKLPRELRDLFGDTEDAVAETCRQAMRAGALDQLARLDAPGD